MTILEALQKTVESIKDWTNDKFFTSEDIDSSLNSTSTNPVQNKVISTEINNLKIQIDNIDVSQDIDFPVDSVNGKIGDIILTADDVGVYVQANEPMDAVDGDIWVDIANDPAAMDVEIPVQSVNGHTGNIIITASDIGAQPAGDYVTSVNGKTGAVTINALPTVSTSDNGKVLMVVNGTWQVVDLNMSIDANGVVSV